MATKLEDEPSANGTIPSAAAAASSGVGETLKSARERLGKKLPDVATQLRIRQPYLQALEDGRHKDLPGGTYAIGFLRTYAEFLGLDGEEMVRRFRADAAGDLHSRSELVFPSPVSEGRIPSGGILFLGLVVAACAYGGWYWMSARDSHVAEIVPPLPERLSSVLNRPAALTADKSAPKPDEPRAADEAARPAEPQVAAADAKPPVKEDVVPPAEEEAPAKPVEPPKTVEAAKPTEPAKAAAGAKTPAAAKPGDAAKPAATQPGKPADAAQSAKPVDAAKAPEAPKPTDTAKPAQPVKPTDIAKTLATKPADAVKTPEPAKPAEIAKTPEPAKPVEAPEPAKPADAAAPDAAGASPAGDTRVALRAASDDCWVQVREMDGQLLLSKLLRKGEVFRVPNRPGLSLTLGNAGALEVLVDGRKAPSLGQPGQVRRDINLDPAKLLGGG